MKKIIKSRFLILFMCIFLTTNSIVVAEVRAEPFTMTVGTLVSGAGGALAALGPFLLGVAVLYAGYEIYQHREAIQDAFTTWYNSASNTVKSWLNTKSAEIEAGDITDGDTLVIPQDVLNQSAGFVQDFAKANSTSNIIVESETTVYINTLGKYVSNPIMKTAIANSSWVTYAPVIIIRNLNTNFEKLICTRTTAFNTMILSNYEKMYLTATPYNNFITQQVGQSSTFYFNTFYTTNKVNNEWTSYYDEAGKTVNMLSGIYAEGNVLGTSIIMNGNKINGMTQEWPFEVTVVFPKGSTFVISNPSGLLNPSLCKVITAPSGTVIDKALVNQNEYTYTPTYETDETGATGLSVPLDSDRLQAIYDYVVRQKTKEVDMMQTLDGEGVKEVDHSQDIIDVITDLPGAIGQAIQDALEWLFVPDTTKVDAFVTEATAIVESNSNLFTYPVELVIRFLNEVNGLGTSDCIISIPVIQYKGYIFYNGTNFNFTDFVEQSQFSTIYAYYKVITDFILIIAVLNLSIKKGSEIIRGN